MHKLIIFQLERNYVQNLPRFEIEGVTKFENGDLSKLLQKFQQILRNHFSFELKRAFLFYNFLLHFPKQETFCAKFV